MALVSSRRFVCVSDLFVPTDNGLESRVSAVCIHMLQCASCPVWPVYSLVPRPAAFSVARKKVTGPGN